MGSNHWKTKDNTQLELSKDENEVLWWYFAFGNIARPNNFCSISFSSWEETSSPSFRRLWALERPVENDDDTVNVSYELKPIKISGLCVKKQTLFSHVWINMVWTDINLKWNPSDYGNIKTTRISPDKIWVPDIVPFQAENINQVDPHKLAHRL